MEYIIPLFCKNVKYPVFFFGDSFSLPQAKNSLPYVKIGIRTPAPAARLYSRRHHAKDAGACGAPLFAKRSRKGRQAAKDAKGEESVIISGIIVLLSRFILFTIISQTITLPPSPLPFAFFAPLRLCVRNWEESRAAGAGE